MNTKTLYWFVVGFAVGLLSAGVFPFTLLSLVYGNVSSQVSSFSVMNLLIISLVYGVVFVIADYLGDHFIIKRKK